MKTAPVTWLPDCGAGSEALIREARRRQRRRYLAAGGAIAAIAAGATGLIAGLGSGSQPPGRHHNPSAPVRAVRPKARPALGPTLVGAATTVLMWPVGYPAFGPDFGPPAYRVDLSTGQLSRHQFPGIVGCDCQPYVIGAGGRLVYAGTGGTTVISADLKARPQVLGATEFFAPSAAPNHVWLVRFRGGYLDQAPVKVQSVPIAGGRRGPVITLPAGAGNLLAGTDAGLLLGIRGPDFGLALWHRGAAPMALPYSPLSEDGFDASARLIAYGTGCSWHTTARHAPLANTGYRACKMLRVFNVVTGKLLSYTTPPGSGGWVPSGFSTVSAISPGDHMIAAYAAVRPQGQGRVRLYLTRLSGGRPRAVPSSSALLSAKTAWSASGKWLLYQGPGRRLWAYQVTTGKTRTSRTPCCLYTVMVATPSQTG
jgi:hypothetical protein